ncbi:Pantothenate transporter liz1 [Leucoagaricus sp. SymC.cos]|nr:Pantothenate transporter liz1 [Leucoagaricus sp. SymC.cos]
MTGLHHIKQFLWGEPPATKQEARLLLKIDWFILSYCCLMHLADLDRSNVNNAFVSGMKEDLSMFGTELNVVHITITYFLAFFQRITTIFTCGYIVGMIPNNLMLQVVSPRIWLPLMQLIWGVYAIRFFQGMAESSTFVGTHYILGSWYKSAELGKRSGIFTSSGLIGTLFSGILQAAIYNLVPVFIDHNRHLNGKSSLSGWRWLFIIDGIITLPIAFYGYFIFPDLPQTTKAFYLTEEERELAYTRLQGEVQVNRSPLSWKLVRRILSRWRWYACSLLFAISGETESFGSNNIMGQWLKAIGGYTVEQIGYIFDLADKPLDFYPSGVTAVAIASTLVCATWTDYTRVRWPVLVYMSVACIVASFCILVWSSPTGLKFFAYYIAGASYAGQATTFAWANEICADDDQERSVVLASMNMWNNVINAWWSIVFYPATDAPRFHKGMIAMLCVCVATLWNNVINAWWSIVFYPATDAPRFHKGMIAMLCVCVATLGVTYLVYYLEQRERRRKRGELNRHEPEPETGEMVDSKD